MVPTKHQHYIPRMILKRWEYWQVPMSNPFEREGKKKKNRIRVIYRNVFTGIEEIKDIRDICYMDWLYEYKKDGKEVDINFVENQLGQSEDIWSKIIDKVEKELSLSDTEVNQLKKLIIKQAMRIPKVMYAMPKTLQTLTSKKLSEEEADRYYKISAFATDIPLKEQWAFQFNFEYYASTSKLMIYHTDGNYILCAECPVLCLSLFRSSRPIMCLPISPHYMLGLVGDCSFNDSNKSKVNDNYKYINLDADATKLVNDCIYECGTHIISNCFANSLNNVEHFGG